MDVSNLLKIKLTAPIFYINNNYIKIH
jgi:hypothetical protein